MKKASSMSLTVIRRISQIVSFMLFLFLFVKTDYSGSDELSWAVNLLFRIDPFLGLSAVLASKAIIILMLPGLVTLALSAIFGRMFCGWVCPMGGLIDCFGKSHKPGNTQPIGNPKWKYYLLFFVLASATVGLPLAGYFDPFSLLVRGMTFGVQPAVHVAADGFFTWTYNHAPAWVNALTEPIYGFMKQHLLPLNNRLYALSAFCFGILVSILLLARYDRRFFCCNLCPLGALLASVSKYAPVRIVRGEFACGSCHICQDVCRMRAIDENRTISQSECVLCMDCIRTCPGNRITYGVSFPIAPASGIDLSRRSVLTGLAAGALSPMLLAGRPLARHADPNLIRPPGALAEKDFLSRCVRCGECMKVCIGNALHAVWLEAGIEGIFTPQLVGRIGYCEYNCTLCGQVCPTGAIQHLDKERKQKTVIGRAYFDKNRCLPYAAGIPCIVCEEHCPTQDKAIKFREAETLNSKGERVLVRQPYIIENLCIGCGICENRCPVNGQAAILLTAEGESRHGGDSGQYGY